jgi:hypothetical protein
VGTVTRGNSSCLHECTDTRNHYENLPGATPFATISVLGLLFGNQTWLENLSFSSIMFPLKHVWVISRRPCITCGTPNLDDVSGTPFCTRSWCIQIGLMLLSIRPRVRKSAQCNGMRRLSARSVQLRSMFKEIAQLI